MSLIDKTTNFLAHICLAVFPSPLWNLFELIELLPTFAFIHPAATDLTYICLCKHYLYSFTGLADWPFTLKLPKIARALCNEELQSLVICLSPYFPVQALPVHPVGEEAD